MRLVRLRIRPGYQVPCLLQGTGFRQQPWAAGLTPRAAERTTPTSGSGLLVRSNPKNILVPSTPPGTPHYKYVPRHIYLAHTVALPLLFSDYSRRAPWEYNTGIFATTTKASLGSNTLVFHKEAATNARKKATDRWRRRAATSQPNTRTIHSSVFLQYRHIKSSILLCLMATQYIITTCKKHTCKNNEMNEHNHVWCTNDCNSHSHITGGNY